MDHMGSNKIVKLIVVVDNIEEAAKHYQALFKLAETPVVKTPDPNKVSVPVPGAYKSFHGEENKAKLKVCIVNLEPIYLEIIQPYDDMPSPWLEYLERHGPGVCFISFYIDGFQQHIDLFEKGGLPMSYVEEKGFERYAYFDTQEKLGVGIELKERKPLE